MPISKVILWKISKKRFGKSLFYFSISSATTYLNVNIGGILNNPENKAIYSSLLNEITAVANAKGLRCQMTLLLKRLLNSKKLKDATSSMHRDLLAGRNTEVVSLTKYGATSKIWGCNAYLPNGIREVSEKLNLFFK
jgi:2-dehydropantoate 2-reductase